MRTNKEIFQIIELEYNIKMSSFPINVIGSDKKNPTGS